MKSILLVLALWLAIIPGIAWCEATEDAQTITNSWPRAWEVFTERTKRHPMAAGNPWQLLGNLMMGGLRVINESVLGPILSFVPVIWVPLAVEEAVNVIDPVSPAGSGFYKNALGSGIKSFARNLGEWLAQAVDTIERVLADLRAKAQALSGAGLNLLALLTGVSVLLLGLNWMLDADLSDVIRGGFEIILVTSLAFWFLKSYGAVFDQGLSGSFSALGAQMAKGLAPQGAAIVGAAAKDSPLYQVGQTLALQTGAVWDAGVSGNPRNWGVSVASIVTIVAMLAAMILFFIHYVHILVRLSIAHIVAPLFIACLPLKQTRFLFEGWLKYIIACGLSLMLLYLMVALGTAILAALPDPGAKTQGTLDLSAALLVLVLAMLTVRLTRGAEQLATNLLHGHASSWAGAAASAWAATGGRVARGVSAAKKQKEKQKKQAEKQKKQANKTRGSR